MSKKMYIEVDYLPEPHHKYMAQDENGYLFYYQNTPIQPIAFAWGALSWGDRIYAGRSKLRAGWNKYYYEIIR